MEPLRKDDVCACCCLTASALFSLLFVFFLKAASSGKHLCDINLDKCAQEMHCETTNAYSPMHKALSVYYVDLRALDLSKSLTPM